MPLTAQSHSETSSSTKGLYIYQRDEYDEGMHAYSQPIHIEETCSDDRKVILAVLYNLGLAYLRQGQNQEAMGWFQRALSLTHATGVDDDVNPVAVHHNIGYLFYRMGQYRRSNGTIPKGPHGRP